MQTFLLYNLKMQMFRFHFWFVECIAKADCIKPVGPKHDCAKKEDPYLITKMLDHPCMSAGKLCLKPHCQKPTHVNVENFVVSSKSMMSRNYSELFEKKKTCKPILLRKLAKEKNLSLSYIMENGNGQLMLIKQHSSRVGLYEHKNTLNFIQNEILTFAY